MTEPLHRTVAARTEASRHTYTVAASVSFVTAVTIVIGIHEFSHSVAGTALGYGNTLYPFGVTHHPDPTRFDAAAAALTGPVFSLVVGGVAMAWQPLRRRRGYGQLVWLWFAWASVMEGVGYLLLTPFGVGDTGSTAATYAAPLWITGPVGAIGVLGTIWLARSFARVLLRHTDGSLTAFRSVAFYPWMIGTAVALGLMAFYVSRSSSTFGGDEVFGVLLGAFALGVWAPLSIPFTHRIRAREPESVGSAELRIDRVPVTGVILLVALVALNVFVLGPGLAIG